jgi:D-amino-acid oxidase
VKSLEQRLIVNCTGLGSAVLFGDGDMLAIKGQMVVLAPQPEVDYITIGPAGLYMMPRRDGIVLGGTFQRGEWSLEPDPVQSRRILAGNRSLFARLT